VCVIESSRRDRRGYGGRAVHCDNNNNNNNNTTTTTTTTKALTACNPRVIGRDGRAGSACNLSVGKKVAKVGGAAVADNQPIGSERECLASLFAAANGERGERLGVARERDDFFPGLLDRRRGRVLRVIL
jgi:hypothetical protein